MKMNNLNKQVIFLVVVLTSLVSQTTIAAAYDNANYTPEEVRQINKATIAKEQAERLRKKQLRILEERRRQLAYNQGHKAHGRHTQRQSTQQFVPKKAYSTYKVSRVSSSIPAWRRAASSNMTRSRLNDGIFSAAKNRNLLLFKQLVNEGANVTHKNFNGESALHIAASLGNIQMVRYLLAKGANVNAKTGKNWLPIHHAMRFEHPVVANYLIAHKASLWFKNTDGFSALDFASKSKNTRMIAIAKRHGR
jgi:hypothetical protein